MIFDKIFGIVDFIHRKEYILHLPPTTYKRGYYGKTRMEDAFKDAYKK